MTRTNGSVPDGRIRTLPSPAGNLCKEAMKYNSKITFEYSGNTANAKSVMRKEVRLRLCCHPEKSHDRTALLRDYIRFPTYFQEHNGLRLLFSPHEFPVFLDDNTTGDGLLSALHLLQVMVETKKKLSELAQIMEVLPQALVNAKVPNHKKESYMEYSEIAEAIGELEKKFAGEGRVLIRPSGTEPLVRVMIEGKNQEVIQQEAKQLADLITKVML